MNEGPVLGPMYFYKEKGKGTPEQIIVGLLLTL